LGKATLTTPLYISVAWTLIISYQIFTQTAVATVVSHVNMFWPSIGSWLSSRMDMLTFVYAFAWIFVLSSVIPSVILERERSVLIQFFVCLTLTLVALIIQDTITNYASGLDHNLSNLAIIFCNPFLAVGYLLAPFIVMLIIDVRARRKHKRTEELGKIAETYLENAALIEENAK